MKFGSLFAGIGGFDLGLERAGMECAWQVEIDEFCRKVLAKHWPNVERFEDVRECGKHNLLAVDLICGGFPCQDISNAGKRAGIDGARSGLWNEMHRIVRELEPRYVVVENVAALLNRGMGRVLGDLASCGYDAEWQVLSACMVGASHTRERVFVVAYPAGYGQQGHVFKTISQEIHDLSLETLGTWNGNGDPQSHIQKLMDTPGNCVLADGVPSTVDIRPAIRCYGNAVVPQVVELIGRAILEADGEYHDNPNRR